MNAIWAEMRRAFRLTFLDGMAAMRLGARSHAGWWQDRHLRKGYLFALPLLIVGAAITIVRFMAKPDFSIFFAVMIPAALLANLVWFAVAAYSRAKAP